MAIPQISIAGRQIAANQPVYIIAELSANHNQDFQRAVALVQAAKEAGADAIKLQTYTADTLTIDSDREYFRIGKGTLWSGQKLYDLYCEAYTPWEWQPKLKRIAESLGMDCFSTPFDKSSVDFLMEMDVQAMKVASFEIVDIPLLEMIGATKKPVIVSTGMATQSEIREAVDTLRKAGATEIALLKCTSAYPALPESMNLRTITAMAEEFQVPCGLSDHTLGTAVPVASVALGACIIEKHLTLSRNDKGPDSAFSLEPHEFREMVASVRTASAALGAVSYGASEIESSSLVFRRSLFVVKDIESGETLTESHVRSIRPGYGLHSRHLKDVIGKPVTQSLQRGTPLDWKHVDLDGHSTRPLKNAS